MAYGTLPLLFSQFGQLVAQCQQRKKALSLVFSTELKINIPFLHDKLWFSDYHTIRFRNFLFLGIGTSFTFFSYCHIITLMTVHLLLSWRSK